MNRPLTRFADPHHFNVDPHPAFHFNADPDANLRPLVYRPARAPFGVSVPPL